MSKMPMTSLQGFLDRLKTLTDKATSTMKEMAVLFMTSSRNFKEYVAITLLEPQSQRWMTQGNALLLSRQ
jgi:hypothetical protein